MLRAILNIDLLTALYGKKFNGCYIISRNGIVHQTIITEPVGRIETLPAKCKKVINQNYSANQTIHEIKARSGVSESTARNRLGYGLHLLKMQFSKKPKSPV